MIKNKGISIVWDVNNILKIDDISRQRFENEDILEIAHIENIIK